MRPRIHSLWAALLILGVGASGTGVCAGWQATAEARMACCHGAVACPMHAADRHGETTGQRVSQAEADTCCASAEPRGSTPSAPSYSVGFTLAMVASPVPAVEPDVAAPRDLRVDHTPPDASPVPKHLFLSVFLI